MSNSIQPLVIIGTGLAGYSLAREFRKLNTNQALILITKDNGDYYSKPMLSTALTKQKTPKQLATASVKQMAQELKAEIITHTQVATIDPKLKTVSYDNKTLQYEKMPLCNQCTLPEKNYFSHATILGSIFVNSWMLRKIMPVYEKFLFKFKKPHLSQYQSKDRIANVKWVG